MIKTILSHQPSPVEGWYRFEQQKHLIVISLNRYHRWFSFEVKLYFLRGFRQTFEFSCVYNVYATLHFWSCLCIAQFEKEKLKQLSQKLGIKQSALIRDAIDQFLEKKSSEKQSMRNILKEIAGLWSERADLPDFDEIRREMDRPSWIKKCLWTLISWLICERNGFHQ